MEKLMNRNSYRGFAFAALAALSSAFSPISSGISEGPGGE
jgi:hypothetical protein